MIKQGLLEEVRGLLKEQIPETATSMQGIGYKEWFPYFRGECSFEETVSVLKRDTRHFAKRQLTWFRRERDVLWMEPEERLLDHMLEMLRERKIIS